MGRRVGWRLARTASGPAVGRQWAAVGRRLPRVGRPEAAAPQSPLSAGGRASTETCRGSTWRTTWIVRECLGRSARPLPEFWHRAAARCFHAGRRLTAMGRHWGWTGVDWAGADPSGTEKTTPPRQIHIASWRSYRLGPTSWDPLTLDALDHIFLGGRTTHPIWTTLLGPRPDHPPGPALQTRWDHPARTTHHAQTNPPDYHRGWGWGKGNLPPWIASPRPTT